MFLDLFPSMSWQALEGVCITYRLAPPLMVCANMHKQDSHRGGRWINGVTGVGDDNNLWYTKKYKVKHKKVKYSDGIWTNSVTAHY